MGKLLRAVFGKGGAAAAAARPEVEPATEPRFDALRRPCWLPVVEEGDGPGSKFAGSAVVPAGEAWPKCANCGRSMQLFLQLDLASLPEECPSPAPAGIFQFFYCTSTEPICEIDCAAYDPFARSTLLRVVGEGKTVAEAPEPPSRFPARRIVEWRRVDDLPGWEESASAGLTEAEGEAIGEAGYPRVGDKLGGWPAWVQGVEYPDCPECGGEMRFFFQLDSEDHLPFLFGDAGCGHVTFCERHRDRLAFRWACH